MSDDREGVERCAGAGLLAAIDAKRGRGAAPAAPDPPAAPAAPAADPLRAAGEGLLAAINRRRGIAPPAPEAEQDQPESESEAELRRGRELAAEHYAQLEHAPSKTGIQARGDA